MKTRGRRRRSALVIALLALAGAPGRGGAQEPVNPHGTLPESLDCSVCHTPEAWTPLRTPLRFRHGASSGFDLSDRHREVRCRGCHLDLRFDAPELTASDCGACHLDPHEGRMTSVCASCHTTRSFRDVEGLAVHSQTNFPLTGAHLQVTCESCHVDEVEGAFAGVDTECASCHFGAFEAASTVDHVAAGYPTMCTDCHSTVAWSDAPRFDHAASSGGWTLSGAHELLRCASCHQPPGLTLRWSPSNQEDCFACHTEDYQRRHASSQIPTSCADCHTEQSWGGATFAHETTGFALLGRHLTLSCEACHAAAGGPLLFPPPTSQNDCIACHQADYDAEHAASGFPTSCLDCHGVERWEETTFDHDARFFPIFRGTHAGEWSACSECHTAPTDFSIFTCLSCHEHNQADMNDEHEEVAGYVYESNACFSCHPTGDSGDS